MKPCPQRKLSDENLDGLREHDGDLCTDHLCGREKWEIVANNSQEMYMGGCTWEAIHGRLYSVGYLGANLVTRTRIPH